MNISYRAYAALLLLALASCQSKEEKKETATPVATTLSNQEIVGLARIEPADKVISLASEVGGIVAQVYKKENDVVEKGNLILELNHAVEDAKLAQINSRLATQKNEIEVAVAASQEQAANLSNKKKELERLTRLLDKGAETRQTVDNLQTEVAVLEQKIRASQGQIAIAKTKLQEIIAEQEVARQQQKQYFVYSRSNGRIMTMNAKPGEAVGANQAFAEFIPEGNLVAVCEIDELFADKIQPEQSVAIRQIGSNTVVGKGKVIYASAALKRKSLFSEKAGDQEDRRVREIKVALDKQDGYLINSRVECVIETAVKK